MSFTVFTLSKNSRHNTTIADPSGNIAYWIETASGILSSSPTYIYKSRYGGGRDLVASVEFHAIKKDTVQFGETSEKVNDLFIPKSSFTGA